MGQSFGEIFPLSKSQLSITLEKFETAPDFAKKSASKKRLTDFVCRENRRKFNLLLQIFSSIVNTTYNPKYICLEYVSICVPVPVSRVV